MPWHKTSETNLYTSKRVKVKELTLSNPETEQIMQYEVIEREQGVAVMALTDEGKIILVRQYRVPVDAVTLDLPGGGVNPEETPLEGAKRELEEEIGYQAQDWVELITYYPDSGRTEGSKTIFLARDLMKTQQRLDDTEDIEVIEMTPAEIKLKIRDGVIQEHTLMVGLGAYLLRCNTEVDQ